MDKSKELGTENILKLLLKFSVPAIVGMLVNVLYSLVDRIFVGKYIGSLQLSGVGVTFPISNVIMGFGMLAGIGAAAVISIKMGQQKEEEAETVLGNTLVLLVIFSIFITFFGLLFLEPILKIFGAGSEIMPYAKQFAFITLAGCIFQMISFGLNATIRSQGNPKFAMNIMILGGVINFIANPIFIFIFKLGVIGSALSTVISTAVISVPTLRYFISGKGRLKFKKENMKIQLPIVKQIISIGMSPFAMQIAASFVTITFNKGLESYGGSLAIGAMALINSITLLILMPVFGINQGVQPIIGYNYGAKNYKRVKQALIYAVSGATVITTICFVIVQLFPRQIMSIFNGGDIQLLDISARGLVIFLLGLPVTGAAMVLINYYQAVAKAKLSMILSLLRQVILLIPLLLIMPGIFKLDGVWMAQPISDFLAAIITAAFIIFEFKKLNELEKKDNITFDTENVVSA